MKKFLSITLCLVLVSLVPFAHASIVFQDTTTPSDSITYINTSMSMVERGVIHTQYISAEELWYAGHTDPDRFWIVQATENGHVKAEQDIQYPNGRQVGFSGFSVVDDHVMVAMIDNATQTTLVGISKTTEFDFIWYEYDWYASKVEASPDGLLLTGYQRKEEKHDMLWIALIDIAGSLVFERIEENTQGGSGYAMAQGYGIAIAKKNDSGYDRQFRYILKDGQERWTYNFPSGSAASYATESDGTIYLYGRCDDKDSVGETNAKIICLNADTGTVKWEKTFDDIDSFSMGISYSNGCVAYTPGRGSPNNDFLCSLDTEGNILQQSNAQTTLLYKVLSFTLTEGNVIKVMGSGTPTSVPVKPPNAIPRRALVNQQKRTKLQEQAAYNPEHCGAALCCRSQPSELSE